MLRRRCGGRRAQRTGASPGSTSGPPFGPERHWLQAGFNDDQAVIPTTLADRDRGEFGDGDALLGER